MKKVVILGGGVAGMSAAHELIERGFSVDVYESKIIPGGKARSISVPDTSRTTAQGSHKELPGEHGFRFFPRFYKHVIDTMSRIPYGNNGTVVDNLVDTTRILMARYGKKSVVIPARSPRSLGDARVILNDLHTVFGDDLGISREDLAFFASRIWQIITSCQERRLDEYEKLDWWDFIEADSRSDAYQKFLGHGITRSLVAAKAHLASTKTIGDIFVQLLFDIIEPGPSTDRVLNGPTNDVWINPWLDYLTKRGVRYHLGAKVQSLHCSHGRIQSATITKDEATFEVRGDYFIAAVPVERMASFVTPAMIAVDPGLAHLRKLSEDGVSWMNGIQLYLTRDVSITRGHVIYIDSPWALTSISQKQFWPDVDLTQYADGSVKGILSIDISEWDEKGLNGKTAKECTSEEVKAEVWDQLQQSLNVGGEQVLKDAYLHEFFLDPDIYRDATGMDINDEPLLVNLINSWALRPEAVTRIPNLFLASDYVRTYTDLATMEGANEAARRAVNGIIDASGIDAPKCGVWNLHEPEIFAPWREMDRIRYQNGLPWDDTPVMLALAALNVAEQAMSLLEQSLGTSLGMSNYQAGSSRSIAERAMTLSEGMSSGLDSEEISQELLIRLERTLQALAASGMESMPLAQPDRRVASGDQRNGQHIRSGRVKIIPL